MTYIAVCVYNRLENIRKWISIWDKFNRPAPLVIIHNNPNPNKEWEQICKDGGAIYIPRKDVGMDIGAFQDICRNRLPGFPEDWKRVLWCCDDCFPMTPIFIEQYEAAMKPGIGVAAMQISHYVRDHIRTTGFMIDRVTAEKLVFPVETITTKEQCYQFEHRQKTHTFLWQIQQMGLRAVQVAPNETSPMWDSGYHRRVDREKEFNIWYGFEVNSYVTFLCTIHNSEYPAIVYSLLAQTNSNWKLWLIHNGPGRVKLPIDSRITITYTDEDTGFWGHPNRAKYLQLITTRYIVITNHDNYYTPVFVDKMMGAIMHSNGIAAYCSQMVHSYTDWNIINCKISRGYIDCGGVILSTKEAQAAGWNNINEHSADWFFFNDIIKKYGVQKWVMVKGCLFVHN